MMEKVNHPSHYNNNLINVEVIDIISLFVDRASFDIGNAIKYIFRAPYKNDAPFLEHLKKALWYLNDVNTLSHKTKPMTYFEKSIIDKICQKMEYGSLEEKLCAKILRSIFHSLYAEKLHEARCDLENIIKDYEKGLENENKNMEKNLQ